MLLDDIAYDYVLADELELAHQIEIAGYPPDEAASLDALRYRQSSAPKLFLGAYRRRFSDSESTESAESTESRGDLLGYVCATLAPEGALTHASMSAHIPGAPSVCIHSVCVDTNTQRRRLGSALLREYIARLEGDAQARGYTHVVLITHAELRAFYQAAGFVWAGSSAVQHGAREWFEMRRELGGPDPDPAPAAAVEGQLPPNVVPADLLAALSKPAVQGRAASRLFASFERGAGELTTDEGGAAVNKFDLVCPHRGCELVVLLSRTATLVETDSIELEPRERTPHPDLPALPAPPARTRWWLVTGGPMTFENVGFTRPVGGTAAPSGKRMKLLACAGCDLGPIGWCEEGGSQHWVHVERVAYRT